MEMNYSSMEYQTALAAEINRSIYGEAEKPCRCGLNIYERLEMLQGDLALDMQCMAESESEGEMRALYTERIAKAKTAIRETEAEIAIREAIISGPSKKPKKPTEKQAASRSTASKVCAMANRMPRALPRKAAFAAAWQIAKRGYYEIAIAGVSYGSRQEALRRLASYDPENVIAVLVPEPDCAHDPGAIAVKVMVNGGKGIYTLGYVPRSETAIARAFLGRAPRLELAGGETKGAKIRLAA